MGIRRLTTLYNRFNRESLLLENTFTNSINFLIFGTRNEMFLYSGEMAIIRLSDCWARFCRDLIFWSACCIPLTAQANRIPRAPGIRNISNVINTLNRINNNREPLWHIPAKTISAAIQLCIQNRSTISLALGANIDTFEELRLIRNFFAHRCKDTANKIRNFSSLSHINRLNLENLGGEIVQPNTTRYQKWVNDLRIIAKNSIQ